MTRIVTCFLEQPNFFAQDIVKLFEQLADNVSFGLSVLHTRRLASARSAELAAVFEAIAVADASFVVTHANRQYIELVGFDPVGWHPSELVRRFFPKPPPRTLGERAVTDGPIVAQEVELAAADGTTRRSPSRPAHEGCG